MATVLDNQKIGEFIKVLLKEKNMTQEDLAKMLNVSKAAVSQNLRGKSTFDMQNLMRIAEYFNITLDELINGRKNEQSDMFSPYQKAVEKGVSVFNEVNTANIHVSEPDMYGKVLVDYVIENKNVELFRFLNDNKVKLVEKYYHRAKEVYLNIIQFMLENDIEPIDNYIHLYTEIHASFMIIDTNQRLVIWNLLNKPKHKDQIRRLMVFETKPVKKIFNNLKSSIPFTAKDLILIIAEFHLDIVLEVFTEIIKQKGNIDYLYLIDTFANHQYYKGIIIFNDSFFTTDKLSWLDKTNYNVQGAFLSIANHKQLDVVINFANHDLYTNLTKIVNKLIEVDDDQSVLYLLDRYEQAINYRLVAETCVKEKKLGYMMVIKSRLTKDDFDYLLSVTKDDDIDTMLALIRQGASIKEKYYNLSTFKKFNNLIQYLVNKEGE